MCLVRRLLQEDLVRRPKAPPAAEVALEVALVERKEAAQVAQASLFSDLLGEAGLNTVAQAESELHMVRMLIGLLEGRTGGATRTPTWRHCRGSERETDQSSESLHVRCLAKRTPSMFPQVVFRHKSSHCECLIRILHKGAKSLGFQHH